MFNLLKSYKFLDSDSNTVFVNKDNKVGKVIKEVMTSVDSDWTNKNSEFFDELIDNPVNVKEVLVKIYKEGVVCGENEPTDIIIPTKALFLINNSIDEHHTVF